MNVDEFYDQDARRRLSREAHYGRRWRVASDPAVVFGLHWIEETREIYVYRQAQRQYPLEAGMDGMLVLPYVPNPDEYVVQVLGWAESEEILDEALDGWEAQMDQPNSLEWVRARLKDAEARTEAARDHHRGDER